MTIERHKIDHVRGTLGLTRGAMLGAAAAFAVSTVAQPAFAASATTFVSGSGQDSGPCTRAAPCRSFAYALTQTSPGGVLAALDPAAFGVVRITQSVTIVGPGKGGAGMRPNSNKNNNSGVDINAPGATVILRGLQIDGGFDGINIGSAATVVIKDTVILGSTNLAINASDTGASVLVQDTTVRGAPIYTSAANFVAQRVDASGSPGGGIVSLGGHVVLDDCNISGSSNNSIVYNGTTISKHTVLSSASGRGLSVEAGGTVYLDTTTTFRNGVGVDTVGPTYSYGNNNFPDGTSGTITPIAGD